jgi:hypothetical protein
MNTGFDVMMFTQALIVKQRSRVLKAGQLVKQPLSDHAVIDSSRFNTQQRSLLLKPIF